MDTVRTDRDLGTEPSNRVIENKQCRALVQLRRLGAAGIRCDLSPATEYDQIQGRYDAFLRTHSQPSSPAPVRRRDFLDPWSPFALPIERLDTGGSDEGGAVVVDDPSSALLEKKRHAWKAQHRGPQRRFLGRRDDGVGRGFGAGSSPDAEELEPPPAKDDDSLPRNANPRKRGIDPNSERSPDVSVGAPRIPREATEHGRSAFGGGNQGNNEGDFGTPAFEFDDDGAMKQAQDAMLSKQKDAWKQPRRTRA